MCSAAEQPAEDGRGTPGAGPESATASERRHSAGARLRDDPACERTGDASAGGRSETGDGYAAVRAPGVTGWAADEDRWLVDKARDGDSDAYEVLIRRHHGRIYRIALRMLGDPDDAEDVAQEVIIQLWTALAGFAGRAAFTTWLYRVVVNRCLAYRRRSRPTRPLSEHEDPPSSGGAGADDVAVARAHARAVAAAIAELPDSQRAVLVLVQLEELSYREAAAVLRIGEGAVRSRLARARATVMHRSKGWS